MNQRGVIVNAILAGLKSLGTARLIALGAVALGMMALIAVLAVRGNSGHTALLYTGLDLREASQMTDALTRAHISFQTNSAGTEILVDQDKVAQARLLLAKDGMPTGGSIGNEIFDRADGLTTSQFQQSINETRALEGELSRTIRLLDGVRAVRVHLVLPRREPFSRDSQPAQASVMLTLASLAGLDRQGVQAIVHLVAAAVPGLRPQNVAVVDSHGNLLARAGEATDATAAVQTEEELQRTTSLRLARAVEQMLERSLGPGHVRAEATVEMSFDKIHETQEHYDPDGQVVRSNQTATNTSKSTESEPNVSVANNLPNANAGAAAGAGSQEQRQDETTNYEISKSVRTIVRDQPEIKRLSIAVMIDGIVERGPDGKPVWRERSPEEIAKIAKLVQGGIGFDEKRGDKVEVVTMRFSDDLVAEAAAPRELFGIPIEKSDVMRLGQTLLIGIVAILALLFVLRPMVIRLTTVGAEVEGPGGVEPSAKFMGTSGSISMAESASGAPRLTGPDSATGDYIDDAMVNLSNIQGQMRASSLRKVAELIDKHPDESISIVRGWMHQETN